jgi:hypothetical protein
VTPTGDTPGTPTASTAVYVISSMSVTGYTVATFGATQQAQFIAGVANVTAVQPSAVVITSITAAGGRRRALLQSSGAVVVAFSVESTSVTSPVIVVALTALTGTPAVAVTTFQATGLILVTAVTTTTPTVTTTPPVAAAPSPSAPVPGGDGINKADMFALFILLVIPVAAIVAYVSSKKQAQKA